MSKPLNCYRKCKVSRKYAQACLVTVSRKRYGHACNCNPRASQVARARRNRRRDARIISAQLSYDPPDILNTQPTLSPTLATVVMRAIRRDPAKRYASMDALLMDLLHQDQVIDVPYIPDPPLWGGRYRAVLFIALLVLTVLAGLVAFGVLAQLIH